MKRSLTEATLLHLLDRFLTFILVRHACERTSGCCLLGRGLWWTTTAFVGSDSKYGWT